MVILHIAAIENNPFNGVCVAAPQHVISQKEYADVGFVNIKNIEINELKQYSGVQMSYVKPFDIRKLPKPFDNPDIVVFHECYRPDYLKIAKNLKRNSVPYVVIPHGELGEDAQKKKHLKKLAANILLFNSFANKAAAIICLSNNELENTHFGKRKVLITNGVNIPEKRKEQFSSEGTKIIYIGRLDAFHKGLDLMIEAVSLVKEKMISNNVSLDIYGPDLNGRYAHVQELINTAHVEGLVELHHEVSGQYKEQLLLESDVFMQTSRFEGMPLGILEALSYGIPCLVTDGTNLSREISCNQAGWSGGSSVTDIANALLKAIEGRKLYSEYGKNGREYVSKNYSWDVIGKQAVVEYQKLL